MIKTAIIGASGYSGAELLRLLAAREDVSVEKLVAHTSAGKSVDELYPVFTGVVDHFLEPVDGFDGEGLDIVFVALPSGEAMKTVASLSSSGVRVIDLSGDFRLTSIDLYQQYYKHAHTAPDLLSRAVYGLPELNETSIKTARLVANPGCYPTAATLPLLPALKHNLIAPDNIVINSLSGTSGAGRTNNVEMSFSEINENIRAYKIGVHQHIPEIQQVLSGVAGTAVTVSFIPHLVPITRGIYTTIHAELTTPAVCSQIVELYNDYFKNAHFIRIRKDIPNIRDVVRTNYCDIYITIEEQTNHLVLISVIDNLVKGAAGQAIQNMNIMFGISQSKGL
ncbi:MAG: N-acetyl-gamma-glutamyl-phosphate reductase [Bacteroidota bacterium]